MGMILTPFKTIFGIFVNRVNREKRKNVSIVYETNIQTRRVSSFPTSLTQYQDESDNNSFRLPSHEIDVPNPKFKGPF